VTLVLLFFGGRILRDFSIALTIGVVLGTYSTVYVASPLIIFIDDLKKRTHEEKR
jgi:preprotein translocase subunit SecF